MATVSRQDHDAAVQLTTAWLKGDKELLAQLLGGASRIALRHSADLVAFAIREAADACVGCWWKQHLTAAAGRRPPEERTER